MADLPRRISCDACETIEEEPKFGEGWVGWGTVDGINQRKIHLCPKHLAALAGWLETTKKEE